MASKYSVYYALIILFLFVTKVHLQNFNRTENFRGNNHLACTYLHCENDDSCVHRTFRCKDPPCPSMLYCAKSRTESLRGPSTCDSVHCSNGYLCMVKVRRCLWDQKCQQQIARCVSQQEYHEGPASCAGFKCPQGNQCILRESLCANPPCKLLRSCSKNKDVRTWFSKCRSLGCPSEFECFLRKPENTCLNPPCKHTPDCITTEEEMTNEYCRGWICPRQYKCIAETVTPCKSNCNVNRTCATILQNYSSFSRRSLNNGSADVQLVQGSIKNEPSQEDLYKMIEEINILLNEQNLTNVIKEVFTSKKIFLPEYTDLDTALPNHMTGEKENYPNNNNMYEKDSHTFSTGNMAIPDTVTSNHNASARRNAQTQTIITFQNEISFEQLDTFSSNVSEILKDIFNTNHEPISLWTDLDEDFEDKSYGKNSFVNNISQIPNNNTFLDTEQYINNFSTDFLDTLIKSLPFSVIETVQGSSDEKLVDQSNSKNSNKKYTSDAVTYIRGDPFTSKNFEEVVGQSSLYSNADFTNNSEPRVDDIVRSFNYSEQLRGNNEGVSLIRNTDETNEATDLGHFFEMNKDTLLPYTQRLIETMDRENDSSNQSDRNANENAEKDSRTPKLMYNSRELHSFYNLPSYGVSDSDHVAVENDNDKTT